MEIFIYIQNNYNKCIKLSSSKHTFVYLSLSFIERLVWWHAYRGLVTIIVGELYRMVISCSNSD